MTEAAYRPPGWGGLRSRLALLMLAVLVPALASAGLLLWSAYQQEQRSLTRQMQETTRALSLLVDKQIGQQRVLLQSLSASRYLASGDWQGFDAQARSATQGLDAWVVVTEADGRQRVNSRIPWGSLLQTRAADPGQVTWMRTPGDPIRISNLFVGRATREPIIAMDIPVRLNDGSTVRLSVGSTARAYARLLEDQGFPEGWTGSIVDANFTIVARNRDPERFVGTSASDGMIERLRTNPSGIAETTTLDGVKSRTAWSRSPRYGWSFVVAAPRAQIEGAARRSLLVGGMIGAALLAVGLTLAVAVARGIARPVGALAQAARDWAEDRPIIPPRTGVAELDALGQALVDTTGVVSAQRKELQDLNASLEARVVERTKELAEATANLAQAQKMEAIGRLTGGVAHDFNNLLMAMLGNLDLLARGLTDPKHLRYAEQARSAGERGAKLTAQLLAFSRRQRIEARPIDVAEAVGAAADILGPALGGAHWVTLDLEFALWPAIGDPTQVELMVVNLVLNARDAMPDGGEVRVSAANVRRDFPSVAPEGPGAGEFVMLEVADQGEGMSPEVAGRVFEPFFTTKEVGKGSGLGLPQVLGLAKQLGGGLELETAQGEGTTVRVYLPRAAAAPRADAAATGAQLAERAGLHLLLVDDNADVRLATAQMLMELGCEVVEADGAAAAAERLAEDPRIQGALIDFAMPGLNGGETAARLREQRPGLPVVLMTGYADLDELARGWTGPVMHKPFTLEALGEEIARMAGEARASA